jgi:hypothetical protein
MAFLWASGLEIKCFGAVPDMQMLRVEWSGVKTKWSEDEVEFSLFCFFAHALSISLGGVGFRDG